MCRRKIIYSVVVFCVVLIAMGWKAIPNRSIEKEKKLEIAAETSNEKNIPSASALVDAQIEAIFNESHLENAGLAFDVFRSAYIGFVNLQAAQKVPATSTILSVADFSMSSKKKRLWIVDLVKKQLLLNTWVSHGRGSGAEMATEFSNISSSHQSSLGFYVTGEVYHGKHGRSLRLDGMDVGFNNKARERAIVIHGASYVSAQAIQNLNRLGLSHGCPAVPVELSNEIIDLVKEKTVLYIHANSPNYRSAFLNEDVAGEILLASYLSNEEATDHLRL